MDTSGSTVLRWQFDLVWSLFEFHLDRLEDDDYLWEPVGLCWTLRRDERGVWVPDWADSEPDPIPVPTIGWISWHIGWWWSVAIDHMRERAPRDRTEIEWPGPGPAVTDWLHGLRKEWLRILNQIAEADLDAPAAFPWQGESGMSVAHTLAWVNGELMKNVAEIGQLRLLRAARNDD
ncbi:DinB family protein [Nocardia sp. KC 131]|uniref:DinB family protein n=1 Tax=Nocardia arseniciresistens TaxID=3392119 RepID=UPI00398EA0EC